MNSAWTKGLKRGSQESLDVEVAFKEAALLRRILAGVLEQKYRDEADKRVSASAYETANWAYFQADAIGYARAMREVIAMLEEKSKNN